MLFSIIILKNVYSFEYLSEDQSGCEVFLLCFIGSKASFFRRHPLPLTSAKLIQDAENSVSKDTVRSVRGAEVVLVRLCLQLFFAAYSASVSSW